MINIKIKSYLTAITLSFILSSCSVNQSDLENFIQQTKSSSVGKVKDLPKYIPYQQFVYVSENIRDPFLPETKVLILDGEQSGELAPDAERRKEPLESFPIDTLQMVGTLEKDITWALIRTPEGTIHRVKPGNYIGQNFGQITELDDEHVTVKEVIKDGMGEWVERFAKISIGE